MELLEYEKEHLIRLRKGLGECMVLLKKDGEFPIEKPCKVALYGNGARETVKGGTGSGEVNSRYFVNVEKGLEKSGFTITTTKWLDAYDEQRKLFRKNYIAKVKKEAKEAKQNPIMVLMGMTIPEMEYEIPLDGEGEIALYVLARNSGEGNDRKPEKGDVKLTDTEVRDILVLNQKYQKFMLLLNVGGVVDLSPVQDVKNILILSQLGVETGFALADVLLGKQNPSGKLTTTWSAYEDYAEIGEFGQRDETRYKEGVYVGYRYFDKMGKKALFPFGYGLSFTEFKVSEEKVHVTGTEITVSATVKNIGKHKGKQVLQLYVSPPQGKLDKPYQTLVGFKKTGVLKTQEAETITISFDLRDAASYDEKRALYYLEEGDYVLRLGVSSMDTKPVALCKLEKELSVRQVQNLLGSPDFRDFKPQVEETKEALAEVPLYFVDTKDYKVEEVSYETQDVIEDMVKKLTTEELAALNIGSFKTKSGIQSVIGQASDKLAGAAGETSSVAVSRGIQTLVMADGPAGIRIAKDYYIDSKGAAKSVGNGMIESMEEFFSPAARLVVKMVTGSARRVTENVKHHYATALPIGTAIAQSFNLNFAETCGDIVGDEMERFGVHLWLAPALNIHRNILCGRNFEYYSEDPYVSGKVAAAITRGVQKHKNCGTTIKHFAANNQEYCRYMNNSQVSERAMREIYLKGFEICVKESQPKALMTSYNLLNGTHTSEMHGLNQDILRCEWGFRGIVMTDWVISGMEEKNAKYGAPVPYKVAASGNDLFMPGHKKNYEDLMQAVQNGDISKRELQRNASRIYRLTKELNQG